MRYLTERLGLAGSSYRRRHGLDMPCVPSTLDDVPATSEARGVEGDLSYYLANESRVRGKKQSTSKSIRPRPGDRGRVDPRSRRGARSLSPSSKCRKSGSAIEKLTHSGHSSRTARYAATDRSVSFPVLDGGARSTSWVAKPQTQSETAWVKERPPLGRRDASCRGIRQLREARKRRRARQTDG